MSTSLSLAAALLLAIISHHDVNAANPFLARTVYEKLRNDIQLDITYKVGSYRNDYWNTKLDDKNQNITYFAPSRNAWEKLSKEMPSEYKQLVEGYYPEHGEHVSV